MNNGRKISGAKYHANRKSRWYERRTQERHVTLGAHKSKQLRVRGGHVKQILLNTNIANVSDGKKIKKTDIVNVVETPQNKFLARSNRLMKGAIIETSLGKARITNRPSQEGQINAVLIK
jgi:small subunit ribosomal protein S8e